MARVQLALNVSDLEQSVDFYSALFGVQPHKRRPGYANFAIADPPLKLVLIEVPAETRGTGAPGALNHLGVESEDSAGVDSARARIAEAGLASFDENDTTCCYALQDKVWVSDPAGAPWEFYVIKDDNPNDAKPATASLPLLSSATDSSQSGQAAGGCCQPASLQLTPWPSKSSEPGESREPGESGDSAAGCCQPAASHA